MLEKEKLETPPPPEPRDEVEHPKTEGEPSPPEPTQRVRRFPPKPKR